jgi:protein gp37
VTAGVSFFFKQWGEWAHHVVVPGGDLGGDMRRGRAQIVHPSGRDAGEIFEATGGRSTEPGSCVVSRVGKKSAGRELDGRTWDEIPGAWKP